MIRPLPGSWREVWTAGSGWTEFQGLGGKGPAQKTREELRLPGNPAVRTPHSHCRGTQTLRPGQIKTNTGEAVSRGAGSGSPFVEMGFIRMRRVRGLKRWVGGWSHPGRGVDQERVQELPGHTRRVGMETGAESRAGAGESQGPHGEGGPDPAERRRQTVRGSVTSGLQTSWSEMSEEGWGWFPAAVGTRGGGPRRDGHPVEPQRWGWRRRSCPPELTWRIRSPSGSILPLPLGRAESLKTHRLLSPSK